MYKESLNRSKSRNISKSHHQEKQTSIINNKKIRHHLNKVISEFSILPKKLGTWIITKHVMKTLFWATVYLAFICMTIILTFEVYQQYREDQTTTNMKAVINNNVTYFPNMTICFKINTSKLFTNSSSSSFNYTSAWSRFFNETLSPEGIFKVNRGQIYDDEIYLSLLKYLALIYEAERAWEPGLTHVSNFHTEESDDWIALKKILMPNIERFNITLEQLKSVFDGKFCTFPPDHSYGHTSLLTLFYLVSGETESIAGSKISFIGMDTICFRVIGYQTYLQQFGLIDSFFLHPYDDRKQQKWLQELTIDLGSESRSTPRRATTRNETYGSYYNRFTDLAFIYMDIGIKALHRKLPHVKGDIQCSSDTSREECENKCFRGWIRANCHCSPITFNLTEDTSSYRNCTMDDYSVCLTKYAENATYLCTNKCVPLCEQWHYDYSLSVYEGAPSSSVIINPKAYDYVIIEQVFICNSFEEFIGALGGALGIWLGLDFVIIIEFTVSLLTKLIKKILLRNVDESEDNHRRSANIKQRGKNFENEISSSNEIGSRVDGHQKENEENENETIGTSIRHMNESEKLRTSRKKGESNPLKEKHVQQRRRRKNNNISDSTISEDKMKNIDTHNGRLRNQKVNIIDNTNAVQDESTPHGNNFIARSSLLQKVLFLLLNGDVPTKKAVIYLRIFEKLFWMTIYIVGSVLTTLWCIKLINLYKADEAVYYPSLTINRTISLPPPSLCIYYQRKLSFDRHSNFYNDLVDYFNQSYINRTSFIQISDGKTWSESLVSIGLLYFSILAASEIKYDDVNFISEYWSQLNLSAGNDTLLRNDLNKSLNDILLPKLSEWNITANELRQKLGAELARVAELKISFTNSNGTIDFVNETSFYTVAITDKVFCYSLPYMVNFTDPNDTLEFSRNRASYPQILKKTPSFVTFLDYLLDPKDALGISSGVTSVVALDYTRFSSQYGAVTRILLNIDGLYTSRPTAKGVKYCSPNTTKSYCRAQCRIELIEKLCNCSPTYWTTMIRPTSGLDECTFVRYMECLNFNGSDDLECKDACLPHCTTNYYRSDDTFDWRPEKYYDTGVIRLFVKSDIYLSIEEKPIFTFNDLLIKV